MGITRRELDKVYEQISGLYRRGYRDRDIHKGIDAMYKALIDYSGGKEITRYND